MADKVELKKEEKTIEEYKPLFKISFPEDLPKLPDLKDPTIIDVRYTVVIPFVQIHVHWDNTAHELRYDAEEPKLTDKERQDLALIEEGLNELINISYVNMTSEQKIIEFLEKNVRVLITEFSLKISNDSFINMMYYIYRDFIGMGLIEPLMRDPMIEDIECNGFNTPIYLVHRKYRNIRTNILFPTMKGLTSFVEKLAQKCGQYVSYANPLLDGSLPTGDRVNATYTEDVTSRGPTFCIKEGWLQFNDGNLKKISEFFDEAKHRFGSKIENGNEIVEVHNLKCIGVDENSLKQQDAKVLSVIKLAPPKKLVNIRLKDGSFMSVTENHKFHVLVNGKLELKEAADLNQGDIMPVPISLQCNGDKKKIDLKKFIMKTDEKLYLKPTNSLKDALRRMVATRKGLIDRKRMFNEYGKYNSFFYDVLNKGNAISAKLFAEMCEKHSLDLNEINGLEFSIYGGGMKDKPKGIKLPRELDERLAYSLGVIIGDGHLSRNSIDISSFDDDNLKLVINDTLMNVFGKCKSYYKGNRFYVCDTVASLFVSKMFSIPIGKKSYTVRIPESIMLADNEILASFIRGLFDTDGTVSSGLSYKTASKDLAEMLSFALARLGIYTVLQTQKDGLFRLSVPAQYELQYLNKVGFYNSKKLALLRKNISKRNMESFRPYRNSGKYPIKLLVDIIKKSRLSLNSVSKNAKLEYNIFYKKTASKYNFVRLYNYLKGNASKSCKEDLELIKNLLDIPQEFVEVVESNVRENTEKASVYDITMNPCKFFVAGNKPLNIFDTVRKFTKEPWTPIRLMDFKTVSPEILAYIWMLVENKANMLIIGGTGSGKTSFLNAVGFFMPPAARVVSIEDSVTGDSKIIIKEKERTREITIKELVDNKIDAQVMTLDEKGKIIFIKPSNYIKHNVKKEIYEVLTRTGRKIKVTKDHSLFSLGENGLIEVKPGELKEKKSFIAVPRILPISCNEISEINLMNHLAIFNEDFLCGEPIAKMLKSLDYIKLNVKKERFNWWKNHNLIKIEEFIKLGINFPEEELCNLRIKSKNTSSIPVIFKITPEFLEFCGLWLGDGSYGNHNANSVIISNVDEECRKNLRQIAAYLGSNYSLMDDGGVSQRIHSTVFYKFMKQVLKFDGYSNSKKIPDFIFGLSNNQVKNFIRGYFSADGCIKKNEVSCASQSEELLQTLQTLLLRFGIISRINSFERKDKCINLSISSLENIEKFKEIGFMQERKNDLLNKYEKKSWHTFSDVIPLNTDQIIELSKISSAKLSYPYFHEMQNIGREYVQQIAPTGSKFNDLSHNDIFWDKVKSINKISENEIEVFDLSIPKYERFICNNIFVHNTRELNLYHENWLPAVSRQGVGTTTMTGERHGEVSLFDLLKESLRQRPDYIIVGEIRGKEAYVLFQAMASGHSSYGTMHAESVQTVIRRLQTPPISLSAALIENLDAVAFITPAIINGKESRRLKEINEIIRVPETGVAVVNTPFVWNPATDTFLFKTNSKIFEKIIKRTGVSWDDLLAEFKVRTKLMMELYKRKIFGFKEVAEIIQEYYKTPETVMQRFGLQK